MGTKKEYNKVEHKPKAIEEEIIVEETEVSGPDIKQTVNTPVVKKKKGLMERLVIGLIGPDGIQAIGKKLNEEIVVPAIKNIIVDSFTSGIQMAIFGRDVEPRRTNYNVTSRNTYARPSYTSRTDYQSSYTRGTVQARPRGTGRGRYLEDYVISTRQEAQDTLDGLRDVVRDYGFVTVADYYNMIGVEGQWTDNEAGWDNLDNVGIMAVRDGYVIKLPAVLIRQ